MLLLDLSPLFLEISNPFQKLIDVVTYLLQLGIRVLFWIDLAQELGLLIDSAEFGGVQLLHSRYLFFQLGG